MEPRAGSLLTAPARIFGPALSRPRNYSDPTDSRLPGGETTPLLSDGTTTPTTTTPEQAYLSPQRPLRYRSRLAGHVSPSVDGSMASDDDEGIRIQCRGARYIPSHRIASHCNPMLWWMCGKAQWMFRVRALDRDGKRLAESERTLVDLRRLDDALRADDLRFVCTNLPRLPRQDSLIAEWSWCENDLHAYFAAIPQIPLLRQELLSFVCGSPERAERLIYRTRRNTRNSFASEM